MDSISPSILIIYVLNSYPFYILTYYIKWVTTSSTHSIISICMKPGRVENQVVFTGFQYQITIKEQWTTKINQLLLSLMAVWLFYGSYEKFVFVLVL